MNEHTTADVTPAPGGAEPRRLVRTPDGKIAGVAAGIGHYLGIDPTIVRIAFLVLAFAGGIGLLLYLACWIVMPKGEAADPVETTSVDPWTAVGIVGLVAGVGLLVGWHGIGDFGRVAVAIALVVGGVLLLGRRGGGPEAKGPPARPEPPAPPGEGGGAPPAPPEAAEATTTELAVYDRPWTATTTPEAATAASGGRRRAPLTALVLGLLGVGLAVLLWLSLDDHVDVATSTALAAALVVVGAGLAVASVTGGAPWLFPIGVMLTGALLVAAAIEPLTDRGIGDERYAAATLADVEREYRLGIGDLRVDLSDVALAGGTRTVDVTLGIGHAEVLVPPDATVVLRGEVGAGRLEAPDGTEIDGVDKELETTTPGAPGAGRLVIELDVGIGEGEVTRG
jgi:phage shock protein PspC (stress-responsive transcriptional regulator)